MSETYETMDVKEVDGATVAVLLDRRYMRNDRLDEFGDELLAMAQQCERLVLDFEKVEFFSSAGLSKLVLVEKTRDFGQAVRLCHVRPELVEVLTITKLDTVFKICRDEAEAVASF